MALSRVRRDSGMNYWPGFVDALSTLVLSVIFLLTVFMVAQFFLTQDIAGKDTALQRLNAQISRLSQLLSLETSRQDRSRNPGGAASRLAVGGAGRARTVARRGGRSGARRQPARSTA